MSTRPCHTGIFTFIIQGNPLRNSVVQGRTRNSIRKCPETAWGSARCARVVFFQLARCLLANKPGDLGRFKVGRFRERRLRFFPIFSFFHPHKHCTSIVMSSYCACQLWCHHCLFCGFRTTALLNCGPLTVYNYMSWLCSARQPTHSAAHAVHVNQHVLHVNQHVPSVVFYKIIVQQLPLSRVQGCELFMFPPAHNP